MCFIAHYRLAKEKETNKFRRKVLIMSINGFHQYHFYYLTHAGRENDSTSTVFPKVLS